MSVDPNVRYYADPLDGLRSQLTELRGLSKIVPPLVEADRERRWEEISQRPSDGEDGDVVDVYGAEAGPEEGYGFADFGRAIRVAAMVTAWAVFQDYLVHELRRRIVEDEGRRGDRLDDIKERYREAAGVALTQLPGWDHVRHAQALRNALVHNQGHYTPKYLDTNLACRPTKDDLHGFTPPDDNDGLIDHELIPLSREMVDGVITELGEFATRVRDAIDAAGPSR